MHLQGVDEQLGVVDEPAVRGDHALGLAGGAGGVDQRGQLVRTDRVDTLGDRVGRIGQQLLAALLEFLKGLLPIILSFIDDLDAKIAVKENAWITGGSSMPNFTNALRRSWSGQHRIWIGSGSSSPAPACSRCWTHHGCRSMW